MSIIRTNDIIYLNYLGKHVLNNKRNTNKNLWNFVNINVRDGNVKEMQDINLDENV